jgi:hypothetical protein
MKGEDSSWLRGDSGERLLGEGELGSDFRVLSTINKWQKAV